MKENGLNSFIGNAKDVVKKTAFLISASAVMLSAQESFGQSKPSNLKNEKGAITPVEIITKPDQNMPKGFRRDQVIGLDENKDTIKDAASLFWFDGSTKTELLSEVKHPELFNPEINYEKINKKLAQNGINMVIAFAGAYEGVIDGHPSGKLEGIVIENGQSVGENSYSSKTGIVYITKDGKIELYRFKNDQTGEYDKEAADKLIARVKSEGGSLFQQIPAIWNGVDRLIKPNDKQKDTFEWRAICQTKSGEKFVLNCSEKITLKSFMIMAMNLKDKNGNPLVDDLFLTDTGVYSEAVFKDKYNKIYPMHDETYPNKVGYTNVIVIGSYF